MTGFGIKSCIMNVWNFYAEGFKNMTVGKSLWRIILVKLFIMFAVLKTLFFSDCSECGRTPQQKADRVLERLTSKP